MAACNLSSQSAYFISQIDGLALTFTSLNWDRWDTIISYANQNTDQSRRWNCSGWIFCWWLGVGLYLDPNWYLNVSSTIDVDSELQVASGVRPSPRTWYRNIKLIECELLHYRHTRASDTLPGLQTCWSQWSVSQRNIWQVSPDLTRGVWPWTPQIMQILAPRPTS